MTISQLKSEATETPLTCEFDAQVQQIITKTTKGGKPYKEFILADGAGQLTLKLWENLPQFSQVSQLEDHSFLRLSGDWQQSQFGIEGIRWDLRELDQAEIAQFLAGDPETASLQHKDWTDILEIIGDIRDPRLFTVCQLFIDEFGEKFRRTAAARRNHHARRGGIVEHVAQMMRCAQAICDVYPKLNRDLLTAGVLFHDCGKLWENSYSENGFTQPYQIHGEMLGHIPLGIELTNKLWSKMVESNEGTQWVKLQPPCEDVRLHLLHLIASHHGTHEFGSPTLPRTPEAHALHHIDNLDAKYEMFQQGYKSGQELAPNIIERQFPLPANLVKPLQHYTSESNLSAYPSAPRPTQTAPTYDEEKVTPEASENYSSDRIAPAPPANEDIHAEEHFFGGELF